MRARQSENGQTGGGGEGWKEELIHYIKKKAKKRKALNENINNEMIVHVRDRDICRDTGR